MNSKFVDLQTTVPSTIVTKSSPPTRCVPRHQLAALIIVKPSSRQFVCASIISTPHNRAMIITMLITIIAHASSPQRVTLRVLKTHPPQTARKALNIPQHKVASISTVAVYFGCYTAFGVERAL